MMIGKDAATAIAAMLEALPDAAFVATRDMRVWRLNARASELAPTMRPEAALALSLRAPDALDAIADVFQTGEARKVVWRERVPVERQFEIFLRPLNIADAALVLAVLRDVTEARAVERMRADFVANASHELRTPLASVLGFIETLQGPAKEDAGAREKFLGVMAQQARRMARLIDDLLSLSRIEQHAHVAPQGNVDLAAVALQVVDALSALAEEAGAQLQVQLNEPLMVRGDRDELVRAVENLVENAIKYGGGAPVRIEGARDGAFAKLAIIDNGPGVAAEHLPRLTERFYRVDDSASRAKGGTGLGLAIVKHIVARHRGRLTIDSQRGAGSTFRIIVPLLNG
jgi:two-component system phosphate regulon sensor histidine kinase PhoR